MASTSSQSSEGSAPVGSKLTTFQTQIVTTRDYPYRAVLDTLLKLAHEHIRENPFMDKVVVTFEEIEDELRKEGIIQVNWKHACIFCNAFFSTQSVIANAVSEAYVIDLDYDDDTDIRGKPALQNLIAAAADSIEKEVEKITHLFTEEIMLKIKNKDCGLMEQSIRLNYRSICAKAGIPYKPIVMPIFDLLVEEFAKQSCKLSFAKVGDQITDHLFQIVLPSPHDLNVLAAGGQK